MTERVICGRLMQEIGTGAECPDCGHPAMAHSTRCQVCAMEEAVGEFTEWVTAWREEVYALMRKFAHEVGAAQTSLGDAEAQRGSDLLPDPDAAVVVVTIEDEAYSQRLLLRPGDSVDERGVNVRYEGRQP